MFYMMTIFAILCIVALLAMAICIPHSTEVPAMSPALLAQADALEVRENAQRFSDNNTIRSVANRFGARVPTRTTVAALRIANLAADIACEPRAALLAAVGTPDTAEESQRLLRDASAARDDLPTALARYLLLPVTSAGLDRIMLDIVSRH